MSKNAAITKDFVPNNTGIFDGEKTLISIIVPAYNEELNIGRLEKELIQATTGLPFQFEFIVIDNCSKDRTGDMLKEICARDKRWRYIRFSRNFKIESSIAAGYHYASGEAMIVLYSDLQEPPSLIAEFLRQWRAGYDVVYGVHTARMGETKLFSYIVKLAYQFVNWCSETPIPLNSGDFRLISRRVRDALEQCGDYHRYTRGLIAWLGFPHIGVRYERRARRAGKSNSDISLYWAYFSNAITGFSLKPLRFFILLGIGSLMLSAALGIAAILTFTLAHKALLGLGLALGTLQLLIASALFFGFGFLGEYAGRTYTEVKHRPLYIVEQSVNLADPIKIEAARTFAEGVRK